MDNQMKLVLYGSNQIDRVVGCILLWPVQCEQVHCSATDYSKKDWIESL